jgi:hypothetical protein
MMTIFVAYIDYPIPPQAEHLCLKWCSSDSSIGKGEYRCSFEINRQSRRPCPARSRNPANLIFGLAEGQQGSGTNKIRKVLGGCVIEENFSTVDQSFIGKSWSVYNSQKREWQQTWVDNRGGYLLFTGAITDGKMELRTQQFERKGKIYISRMVFENISENSLDWNWQRSEDNGKTWVDLWNIHYERKKDESKFPE